MRRIEDGSRAKKIALTMKLWRDFCRLQDNPKIESDLPSFFNSLITWIKEHRRLISDEMLFESGLMHIMGIEPNNYGAETSPLSLKEVKNRLFRKKPVGINNLLSDIYFELIDLLAVSDGRGCPVCGQGELVYVVIVGDETQEVFLECDYYCLAHPYLFERETLSKIEYPIGVDTIPASKEQIRSVRVAEIKHNADNC